MNACHSTRDALQPREIRFDACNDLGGVSNFIELKAKKECVQVWFEIECEVEQDQNDNSYDQGDY